MSYRNYSRRELIIALRERFKERSRIITWLAMKKLDGLAMELGQMEHEPTVVEAARATGISSTYLHAEIKRDYRDAKRKR